MNENTPKLAYSIPEWCELTDDSRTHVYEEIAAGRLIARKRGKRTIITHNDGMAYLENLPKFADCVGESR